MVAWIEDFLNDKYEVKCSTRSWIYNVLEECVKEEFITASVTLKEE